MTVPNPFAMCNHMLHQVDPLAALWSEAPSPDRGLHDRVSGLTSYDGFGTGALAQVERETARNILPTLTA